MFKLQPIFPLMLLLLLSCQSQAQHLQAGSSLRDARTAYFQMDHQKAYAIFSKVWLDEGTSTADRVIAGTTLSRMDWLLYRNPEKALGRVDSLLALNTEKVTVYLIKSRIEAGEELFDQAIQSDRLAIESALSTSEQYVSQLSLADHILSRYQHHLARKGSVEPEAPLLSEGFVLISRLAKEKPGDVDIAKSHLGLSLLKRKGKSAFEAWMSYQRLTDTDQVHPSLIKNISAFENAMRDFNEATGPGVVAETVISGLAESGFYQEAQLVKRQVYGEEVPADEHIAEILLYANFLDELEAITLQFYHQTVDGAESQRDYRKAVRNAGRELWEQLNWPGEAPGFTNSAFVAEMEKRFKAIMSMFSANGYYGLHMGHVSLDDRRRIEQYDQSAEFRYIAIDNMVSNGYSGWFWDGAAESGGWATDDESFLQVRSAYTSGPVTAWMAVTDSSEIKKKRERLADMLAADDSLARINPHVYLEGLRNKLVFEQQMKILDSLRKTGLSGGALRLAFINRYSQVIQGSSIYAHEGRHSIDKKNGYSRNSAELEFTAKLSEIYFSEMPFLSFKSIMSPNMGDGTSHGIANLRVIEGLVAWMEEHRKEIQGFDASSPTMPQLSKLTEAQFRAAVRSMDPMAN